MPLSGGVDVCVSDVEVDEDVVVEVSDVLDVGSEVVLVLDEEVGAVVDEADEDVDDAVVLELDDAVAVVLEDALVEFDGDGDVLLDVELDGGAGGGGGGAVVVVVPVGVELADVGGPCSACVNEARMATFATAVFGPSVAWKVTDHVPAPW